MAEDKEKSERNTEISTHENSGSPSKRPLSREDRDQKDQPSSSERQHHHHSKRARSFHRHVGEDNSTGSHGSFASSSGAFGGFPANAYLQSLQAAFPNAYPTLFTDPTNSNPFLPGSAGLGFGLSSAEFLKCLDKTAAAQQQQKSSSPLSDGLLATGLGKLGQNETAALRQLIAGYRESAALLTRTADELEVVLNNGRKA